MVFSSLPAYLDTSTWNQNNQAIGSSSGNNLFTAAPQLQAQQQQHGGGSGGAGGIRPGSMAERARMANIPVPESALRCPRCDSSNTKFCYYNNYSLSQPRHFCKTCRRYWTRGGALRNVPVGGGCRRNKRSKSAGSKSQQRSDRQNPSAAADATALPSGHGGGGFLGLTTPQLPPLRFPPPFTHPSESFTSTTPEVGSSHFLGGGTVAPLFSGLEPWRFHHAPQVSFLGGVDPSPGGIIPQFPGVESPFLLQPKISEAQFTLNESVKAEETPEMSFSKQLLGSKLLGNDQWNNAASNWSDFCSPSTSNQM